jgi:hypothetical protein
VPIFEGQNVSFEKIYHPPAHLFFLIAPIFVMMIHTSCFVHPKYGLQRTGVGTFEGLVVGSLVGLFVSSALVMPVSSLVGLLVGAFEGFVVGSSVGLFAGSSLGIPVGSLAGHI